MFCDFSKNIYLKKFSKQIEKEHVTNVQFKNTLSMESMEMRTPNMIFLGIFQLLNNPWTYPEAYIALFLYISNLHLVSGLSLSSRSLRYSVFPLDRTVTVSNTSCFLGWFSDLHMTMTVQVSFCGPWPLPAVYSYAFWVPDPMYLSNTRRFLSNQV